MDERSLADAIRRLEQRLSRLEHAAGLSSERAAPPTEPQLAASPAPPPPPPRISEAPTLAVPDIELPAIHTATSTAPPTVPTLPPLMPMQPLQPLPDSVPARADGVAISEGVLGGRVAAWVGAILVMIGAGVVVKHAYDSGWFRVLGGTGRFVLATGGALLLLVLGELALRRYGRAAAAGLFAAGIGSLFVIAAAGTLPEIMKVYGPGGAAIFSLAAAVLGVFIARRSGLLAVGVVVVVGAYLVPIFSGILRLDSALAAPSYITAVLIMALALAHFSPIHRRLREVALGMHALLAFLVLMNNATPPSLKEAFVFLWWGLFVFESIVVVARTIGHDSEAMEREPEDADAPAIAVAVPTTAVEVAVVTLATLASVVASFAFAGAWAGWRDPWAWMPAAQAVLCFVGAAQLHAMRGARGVSGTIDQMVAALAILGAGLISVAVALLFKPEAASVAWAIMGGATMLIAARHRAGGLAWIGALVIVPACLVSAWLALTGRFAPGAGTLWMEIPLPGLSRAALVMATHWWLPALVAIIAVVSIRALRSIEREALRALLVVVAVIAWGTFAFAIDGRGSGLLVGAMLPVAWLALGVIDADRFTRRAAFGAAVIVMSACALVAMGASAGAESSESVRAIALMLATAVALGSAATATQPTLVLVSAALAAIAAIEIAGGRHARELGGREVGEVLVVSATIALGSWVGYAIGRAANARRDADSGAWWRLVALWSALVWLWAAIVLMFKFGPDGAPPMANLMNATAAIVLSTLGLCFWSKRAAQTACAFAIVALVAGSWDLTRLAPHLANTALDVVTLRQALMSAWWAAVAVAAVIAGFAWRLTPLRWLALALLAITAAKVLILDMSRAEGLVRAGALLAVGLLSVGTSIVYARAERRLRTSAQDG